MKTSAEAETTGKAAERANKARLYTAHHVDHRGKCDKALKRSGHLRSSKMLLCATLGIVSRCGGNHQRYLAPTPHPDPTYVHAP